LQEFNITGYVGLELSAKLEGLAPGSAHEFRTRAYRTFGGRGSWGLWSNPVVYHTLKRPLELNHQTGRRENVIVAASPPRSQSPSRLFVGGSPPSPQQLIERTKQLGLSELSPPRDF